jgi:LPXTG-site transpeptidase (sortase) family protein
MTWRTLLIGLERTLLLIGLGLAAWSAKVLLVARYTQWLPIPEQHVSVKSLPGDSGAVGTSGTRPEPGSVIARLRAPALQLSTVVLEGSDDGTLSRAAGHIEDTALPGPQGNIGIAGHRDTIFRALRRARVGDEFDLVTADGEYRYRVTRMLIVDPDDVDVLDPTPTPTLTLVTCWPFEFIGHAPKRFIVQAQLTTDAPLAQMPP